MGKELFNPNFRTFFSAVDFNMITVFQLKQKSLVVDNSCFKVSGVVAAVKTRFVVRRYRDG